MIRSELFELVARQPTPFRQAPKPNPLYSACLIVKSRSRSHYRILPLNLPIHQCSKIADHITRFLKAVDDSNTRVFRAEQSGRGAQQLESFTALRLADGYGRIAAGSPAPLWLLRAG